MSDGSDIIQHRGQSHLYTVEMATAAGYASAADLGAVNDVTRVAPGCSVSGHEIGGAQVAMSKPFRVITSPCRPSMTMPALVWVA